ncbi:MAG: RNA 2'-phosphotransferase [Pseudomonadota bacterium]
MASNRKLISASKFMSLVLRHDPGSVGLQLDGSGWAAIDDLVARSNGRLTDQTVREIVATNDKQRFAISDDGMRIRANQGHSVEVDLGLAPVTPPETLYHGTSQRALDAILREGLKRMSRQHVHLSSDVTTATVVGQRHGKPVVLSVAAGQMHRAGIAFFQSANGVWLVTEVDQKYLSQT